MLKTIFCFFVALMLCAMVVCGGCGYLVIGGAMPEETAVKVEHKGEEPVKTEKNDAAAANKIAENFAIDVAEALVGIVLGLTDGAAEKAEIIKNAKNGAGPKVRVEGWDIRERQKVWYPEEAGGR